MGPRKPKQYESSLKIGEDNVYKTNRPVEFKIVLNDGTTIETMLMPNVPLTIHPQSNDTIEDIEMNIYDESQSEPHLIE